MSDVLTKEVISREDCIFCARHDCTPIPNKMIVATCDALTVAEQRAERLATTLEETYRYLIWLRKPVDLPDSRWPFTCAESDLDEKIRAVLAQH